MISDIQEILLKKHIVDHFLAKNTHAFMAFLEICLLGRSLCYGLTVLLA